MLKRIAMPLICYSPFDADQFMSTAVDAQLDTKRPIVPAGDYRAMFGEFDSETGFRSFVSEKEGKNFGREFTMFTPNFVLQDDPRLADFLQQTGMDRAIVYHKGIFLDLNDNGNLDTGKGKNTDIGKIREAVGQNQPGPWTFANLVGAGPVMVHVIHDPDPNDSDKKYARVNRVVKIS